MAVCPHCGEALEPGSLFCGNCGFKVEAPGAAPGGSPPPYVPGSGKPPGGYLRGGWHLFKQYPGGFIGFAALTLLIQLGLGSLPKVGWIVNFIDYPLLFGFAAVSVRLRQGQPPIFSDFFEGFKNFVTLLLLGLLTKVLVIIGLVVLIVPGIYLAVGYILAPWFVLDRKVDFWEAMELSRRTVQRHWFHFFGLVLLLLLINLLGALLLFFGLLVTIPLSWCALTAAYASVVGFQAEAQPGAATPLAAVPVGPEPATPSGETPPPLPAAGVAERSLARKYDWTPVLILAGFILVITAAGVYFWKFAPPSEPEGGPTETTRKPPGALTAEQYFNKGNSAKYPKDKIVFYTKAIERDPKFVEAYNNRGNAYCDIEQYDLALKDYHKAISLNPDYVIAYHNRAILYFDRADYEKALIDMNKVIKLEPNDANSYNYRGNIYFRQNNYESAIKDYTKAIKLKSDFAAAYANRGNAYLHQDDYEKALGDLNQAVNLKPDFVNAYYYRALLYKKIGAYDKARADYDKAATLDPRLLDAAFPLPEGD